jgi:Leucine-rich repeat (LRR) protein
MQKTPAPEILLRFHHHHHLLFLLLFFFFFFSISLCFVLPSSAVASSSNGDEEDGTAIATDQKQALLDLLKGLQAPNTTNSCITSTWGAQAGAGAHPWPCPSSFCGITCDSEGYVEALDLSEQGLRGRIEPNMVSKLTRLSKLDLSNNRLSGQLPRDIGDLTALNYLNLSSNSIAGSIPSELAKLTALQALDLHANLLRGEIDPSLLAMASLAFVDLSSNKLQGFLPWQPNDTLPVLRTLEHVNLSRNLLTGPLAPPKFSSVFAERLSVLDVSHNQLSGELPDFEFVIALSTLRLDHNSFTGSVPATLLSATLGLLAELDLSNNNLTGNCRCVYICSLFLTLRFFDNLRCSFSHQSPSVA